MLVCPIEKNSDWKKVVSQIGEVNARRLFEEYKHLPDPHKSMAEDLSPENMTNEEKRIKLETHAAQLGPPTERITGPDGETIRIYKARGKEYTPVSTELDNFPKLSYQGPKISDRAANSGSLVHSVFEKIVKNNYDVLTLEKEFTLPKKFLEQAVSFIDNLKEQGTLLSELPLSMSYEDKNLAGTPDIILLKDNGSIVIYDFKTIHQTKADQPPIWDITKSNYKGPRYSTQLMAYGEFIKDILGVPVSDYQIIPLQVFYQDPESETSPISKIEFANKGESITQYGYIEGARRDIDQIFNRKRTSESLALNLPNDLSDELISQITGLDKSLWSDLRSKEYEARAIIEDSLQRQDLQQNSYYHTRRGWVKFKSNKPGERINQVIREVVEVERAGKRDIYLSVKNAIQTGEDPLTSRNARVIPKLLNEYKNSSFTVTDLTSVPNFENKQGWLLLQKGNRVDLLYAGTEYMLEPLPNGKTNLFEAINPNARDHYGVIHNTVGELKSMEGFIVASQFLKANPDIRLGRITLYSETASAFPYVINPLRLYDTVQRIGSHKATPPDIKGTMQELVKFNRDRLQLDYLQAYIDLVQDIRLFNPTDDSADLSIEQKVDINRRNRLVREFSDFRKKSAAERSRDKAQLKEQLLREIATLKSMDFEKNSDKQKELEHLSFLYLQLNDIDLYTDAIKTKIEQSFQGRNLKSGAVMDFLNERITAQKQEFKARFLEIQEKQNIPMFDKFLKESGYSSLNVVDRIFSPTTRFYEPLFEKKEVLNEQTGKTERVNSYRLVLEGTPAYEALTDNQKQFHKFFREQISKIAEIAGLHGWDSYNIPLMHNSLGNSIYKSMNREGSLKAATKQWWDQLTENTEFLNHANSSGKENTGEGQSIFQISNWFSRQTDPGFRSSSVGIHGNTVPDMSHYNSFETNLEKILIAFLGNAIRVQTMNKLSTQFAVAHTVYQYYEANLFGNEFKNNIKDVEEMNTILIHNQDQDRGSIFNKISRGLNRITSYVTLAGNVKAGAIVAAGQQFLGMSRGLSNRFIEGSRYDIDSVGKALKFQVNPKTRKLASTIIDYYGIQDSDTTALMSDLYQTSNKSVFKSKYLYAPFRLGDRWSKANILLGSMIKDGSINAYSLDKEGNLIYKEEDDPRFIGDAGQALKAAITEELAKDNLIKNGKMKQGYETKTINALQSELALLFGGQDRDLRAPAAFTALGRLFFLHKHFFPSIFARAMARPAEFDAYGGWEVFTDEEGKQRARWTKGAHEGLFVSLVGIGRKLLDWKSQGTKLELSKVEQMNLKRMTADLIVFSMIMIIASAMGAAAGDDSEAAKLSTEVAWGVLSDLLMVYNVETLRGVFQPVAVSVVYTSVGRLANSFGTSVTEGNGAVFDQMMETLAPTRSVKNMVELFDRLEE